MAKEHLHKVKTQIIENLDQVQATLNRCTAEGMIDTDDDYYNEILGLIDETHIAESWAELDEVITKAKTLEIDVAAWLSGHGRTSISLPWPTKP